MKFYNAPWKRLLKLMELCKIDVLGTLSKNAERETYMIFIDPPYYYGKKVFYLSRNRTVNINRYEALQNIKVGLKRGSKHFDRFDSDTHISKQQVNSELQLLAMLNLKRIDAFIGTETSYDYIILQNDFNGKFKKSIYSYPGTPGYFAISKNQLFQTRYKN